MWVPYLASPLIPGFSLDTLICQWISINLRSLKGHLLGRILLPNLGPICLNRFWKLSLSGGKPVIWNLKFVGSCTYPLSHPLLPFYRLLANRPGFWTLLMCPMIILIFFVFVVTH